MKAAKDYYKILGVESEATADDIKKAYRKLAVQHHPDLNPGNPEAEERFKLISEAYAVLIDSGKRSQYDASRGAGVKNGAASGQPGAGPGFSYSQEEIFKEFFAGATSRQAFRDMANELKKAGVHFDEKFFDRVFFGGRGFFFGGVFFSGPWGGRVQRDVGPDYRTRFSAEAKNRRETAPAPQKRPPVTESLVTKLGRGVKKVAQGLLGRTSAGLELGDLAFNLTVSADQARTGTEVTLTYQRDGQSQTVTVKVPAGTRDGARLRLRGMGRTSDGRTGDLFLQVRVLS